MLPNEPQPQPQEAQPEPQEFDEQAEYEAAEGGDMQAVANIINRQINDILSDFGVDTLVENDPEYAPFMEAVQKNLPSGNGAAILRAAAKAGKAKAARMADEAKSLTGYQYLARAHAQNGAATPPAQAPSTPAPNEVRSARDYFKRITYKR